MNRGRGGRRSVLALGAHLLGALALGVESGCADDAPPPRAPAPLPPLATSDLARLLPAAGLRWVVRAHPRAIAQVPWLIPVVSTFAPEARLDRWTSTMGFDLRQTPEAWLGDYQLDAGSPAQLIAVRHNARAEQLERRFAARLSAAAHRAEERPDAVRLDGKIGPTVHAFARLGPDVAAWQEGGDAERGPVRIVTARAAGQLAELRGIAATEPLDRLLARFGEAPLIVLAPGPFDDATVSEQGADAARLLAVATGVGAAVRPTVREGLGVALAVAGDFGDGARGASRVLEAAWEELATSETGRILALDRPRERPLPTHTPDAVALAVELDPAPVAEGLRALLERDLDALLGPTTSAR